MLGVSMGIPENLQSHLPQKGEMFSWEVNIIQPEGSSIVRGSVLSNSFIRQTGMREVLNCQQYVTITGGTGKIFWETGRSLEERYTEAISEE